MEIPKSFTVDTQIGLGTQLAFFGGAIVAYNWKKQDKVLLSMLGFGIGFLGWSTAQQRVQFINTNS
jgi:hypothetical protein